MTGANQNFLQRDTTNGFLGLDCEEPEEKENRDNSSDSKTSRTSHTKSITTVQYMHPVATYLCGALLLVILRSSSRLI